LPSGRADPVRLFGRNRSAEAFLTNPLPVLRAIREATGQEPEPFPDWLREVVSIKHPELLLRSAAAREPCLDWRDEFRGAPPWQRIRIT
jgi:hypothetical protein